MLVLHPSSCCDVCLDAYTLQTISQIPHVIPCGHIFCRPCLLTLNPKICPLCRDQFEPNELEKLHVDRPENVDENKENNLLQKLVFSWEAPEVQLRRLALEVDKWLGTRADDTCIVLRKARAALGRYLKLKKANTILQNDLRNTRTLYSDAIASHATEQWKATVTETKLKTDNNALISENEDLKKAKRTLQDDLADIHPRYSDMVTAYETEQQKAVATETKLKTDNNALISENEDLKKAKRTLQDDLDDIHPRYSDMVTAYETEQQKAVATETKLKTDNNALISENEDLKKAKRRLQDDLADIHPRYSDMVIAYETEHRKAVATETQFQADNDALMRENEDLKKAEATLQFLQNDLTNIRKSYSDFIALHVKEYRKYVAAESKLKADNNVLIKDVSQNEDLKAKVKSLYNWLGL